MCELMRTGHGSQGVDHMSGFFGQIIGSVLGGGQQGAASPISGILQQVLSYQDGDKQGVAAIISKFQSSGLGDHVQSWVGTGANAPISAEQIGSVFTSEQVQGWAQQAGTTPEAMREVLANALPHVIDHVTPGGTVPQTPPTAEQMPDLSGMLGKLLGSLGGPR